MPTRVVHRRDSHDVYIGRPSPYGNPFHEGQDGTRAEVIAKYEEWLRANPDEIAKLEPLRGKVIACWCSPLPCHGDVIARILDETQPSPLLIF